MSTYRLLLIDDEDAVRASMKRFFEQLGYEVETAASGEEGLDLFERSEPHVTLLDLQMPGMSGMQVLARLGQHHAVVIMLTGHGTIDLAVDAMKMGAESFLEKPVDMNHLASVVERAAEKAVLRQENQELRSRLSPAARHRLRRRVALLLLFAVAVGVGAVIGATGTERRSVPIPIPLDTTVSAEAR